MATRYTAGYAMMTYREAHHATDPTCRNMPGFTVRVLSVNHFRRSPINYKTGRRQFMKVLEMIGPGGFQSRGSVPC
jgi:hypothetical protein